MGWSGREEGVILARNAFRRRSRFGISAETVRASLWFWPFVAAAASLIVALVLIAIPLERDSFWLMAAWPADSTSALSLLQTVATATMAATTLTFSVTVVALQLSSQQFSPRLLRQFARDPFTQVLLALLVSTFVVSLTGFRGVREGEALPVLLLGLATFLGICSIVGLLAFTGHIVRSLRVETMMVSVHGETLTTIEQTYPEIGEPDGLPHPSFGDPGTGLLVPSARSGFLRVVRVDALAEAARDLGVTCQLLVRPGDHLVVGTPIAEVWDDEGGAAELGDELRRAFQGSLELGYERTAEQDVALGFRQLADIATKAISPGINDPTTAAHAVGYCADLFAHLQTRRLGPQRHDDEHGHGRVIFPDRDLRYYLDLVCVPLRHYGRGDPTVLSALLRMLRDAAASARLDEQRSELSRQVDLVVGEVSEERLGPDADRVLFMAEQARAVLAGDLQKGFADRAGETRSV
jgi:uncharacterized membrane protein